MGYRHENTGQLVVTDSNVDLPAGILHTISAEITQTEGDGIIPKIECEITIRHKQTDRVVYTFREWLSYNLAISHLVKIPLNGDYQYRVKSANFALSSSEATITTWINVNLLMEGF